MSIRYKGERFLQVQKHQCQRSDTKPCPLSGVKLLAIHCKGVYGCEYQSAYCNTGKNDALRHGGVDEQKDKEIQESAADASENGEYKGDLGNIAKPALFSAEVHDKAYKNRDQHAKEHEHIPVLCVEQLLLVFLGNGAACIANEQHEGKDYPLQRYPLSVVRLVWLKAEIQRRYNENHADYGGDGKGSVPEKEAPECHRY